ncbi:unnamed protein product [Polarella glacialis]|uniref:Uncharacterized protein n=1 Tax=Polarella glacialis TaxID=89957 RepID=A0A813J065_POLGL|nr:unnamed protein product [Polarella glacialis]CAE8660107.1 unnamed protein product [Polarella glacialis]
MHRIGDIRQFAASPASRNAALLAKTQTGLPGPASCCCFRKQDYNNNNRQDVGQASWERGNPESAHFLLLMCCLFAVVAAVDHAQRTLLGSARAQLLGMRTNAQRTLLGWNSRLEANLPFRAERWA